MRSGWGLIIAFAVIFSGLIYWGFRYVIPVSPAEPYFPDYQARDGYMRWSTREFQPVFLYTFKKNGLPYVKTAYRDTKHRIVISDVRIGQMIEGELQYLFVNIAGSDSQTISDYRQLGKYFRIGQRVKISYLANSTRTEEKKYQEVIEPNESQAAGYCKTFQYECGAAKATKLAQQDYWGVWENKRISGKFDFVGVSISNSLVKDLSL